MEIHVKSFIGTEKQAVQIVERVRKGGCLREEVLATLGYGATEEELAALKKTAQQEIARRQNRPQAGEE